jgi:hypothetical protein
LVRAGNKSRSPILEFPCWRDRRRFDRLPRKSWLYIDQEIQTVLFLVVELCPLSFRRDDWSNSNMVATALFGDGARPRC